MTPKRLARAGESWQGWSQGAQERTAAVLGRYTRSGPEMGAPTSAEVVVRLRACGDVSA